MFGGPGNRKTAFYYLLALFFSLSLPLGFIVLHDGFRLRCIEHATRIRDFVIKATGDVMDSVTWRKAMRVRMT